ncbi:hypothetical protein [Actinomadura fibrosa]|uniref:Uncharacterized protein n=1 Tax=Actinomadura fibrosa TaxID=111802 RepID=A0ABW2XEG0_9ACTN|nr:hypothetical protein [Actinomadura fibrosa]
MSESAEPVYHLPEKVKNDIAQTRCRQYVTENLIRDDPRQVTCEECLAIRRDEEYDRLRAEDHYGESF